MDSVGVAQHRRVGSARLLGMTFVYTASMQAGRVPVAPPPGTVVAIVAPPSHEFFSTLCVAPPVYTQSDTVR